MLQRLLLISLTLCSLSASAQWQQTGAKVRYVNGLGIPTKDTAAGVAADSSQILIRPADSSLYIKYKRTWVKVGAGGGGTIGGSGTINRVPKFTAGTTLGNSSIVDSASAVAMTINPSGNIGVGTTNAPNKFVVSNAGQSGFEVSPTGGVSSGVLLQAYNRNTLAYMAQSYYALGHTWNVGTAAATRAMDIASGGAVLINTTTDNGVDKLQVNGGMNVSAGAKAQNLSVTNNIDQGSGTADTYYTILAKSSSSGWAGQMRGNTTTGQFEFYHRDNSPTYKLCFAINGNSGKGNTTFYDNAFIGGDGWLTVNGSTNNGVDKLQVVGSTVSTQYKLSALNTAPATASSSGTLGEIRIDANYIYICTATNTWKRVAIATW
jgi:hypothetical protein